MGKRVFDAKLEDLSQMLKWLHDQLAASPFKPECLYKIELATEEALVNVIRYAYPQQAGKIEVNTKVASNSLEVGIRDWGIPFNPLLHTSKIDPTPPLQEKREGGLGILFMTQLVDDVLYEWDETSNFLILIKRVSTK